LTGQYGLKGRGYEQHEFLAKLANRQLTQVWGLGACTLFDMDVVKKKKLNYYPGLAQQGLPWDIGEDRHFCKICEQRHVEMWADPWPDIFHVYRPSDRELIERARKEIHEASRDTARYGDWVCASIQAMQEPNMMDFEYPLRGRLGGMDLVPDLEQWLAQATVGDEEILSVNFPVWWPIEQYHGKERMLKVKLQDVKDGRMT
jgi:hypothetical protein